MTADYVFKIIVAGVGGIGKSTLIATKKTGNFHLNSKMTIGVDFQVIQIQKDGQCINLMIYDLGGQPRFQFMHESYIIGAKAAIIMYDLTRTQTFETLDPWFQLVYKLDPDLPIMLVGTKKDLVKSSDLDYFKSKWSEFEANLVNTETFLGHFFTSAKSMEGVEEIFQRVAFYLLKKNNAKEKIPEIVPESTIG
jgi:Ras-related protein Rab-11A